jgi:hypothetical protein
LRGDKDLGDWESLSVVQKEGLKDAINDLDAGKGIVHEDVISKYRKRYPNA